MSKISYLYRTRNKTGLSGWTEHEVSREKITEMLEAGEIERFVLRSDDGRDVQIQYMCIGEEYRGFLIRASRLPEEDTAEGGLQFAEQLILRPAPTVPPTPDA